MNKAITINIRPVWQKTTNPEKQNLVNGSVIATHDAYSSSIDLQLISPAWNERNLWPASTPSALVCSSSCHKRNSE